MPNLAVHIDRGATAQRQVEGVGRPAVNARQRRIAQDRRGACCHLEVCAARGVWQQSCGRHRQGCPLEMHIVNFCCDIMQHALQLQMPLAACQPVVLPCIEDAALRSADAYIHHLQDSAHGDTPSQDCAPQNSLGPYPGLQHSAVTTHLATQRLHNIAQEVICQGPLAALQRRSEFKRWQFDVQMWRPFSSGSEGQRCQAWQHFVLVNYLLVPLPAAEGLHQGLALRVTCHNTDTDSSDLDSPLLIEFVMRAACFQILHIAERRSAGAVLPPNTAPMNICSGRVPDCCGFSVTLNVRSFASSCTAARQLRRNISLEHERRGLSDAQNLIMADLNCTSCMQSVAMHPAIGPASKSAW